MKSEFTAVIVPCEEGGYSAYVVEIPGAITQGETLAEVRENLVDAIQLLTEARHDKSRQSDPSAIREPIEVEFRVPASSG